MRLIELEPRWAGDIGAPDDAKQGVTFRCPHCPVGGTRLAIFFANPICANPPAQHILDPIKQLDADHLTDHHVGRTLWQRSGETFETLSLTPSVDASAFGHWHGFITAGEAK